AVTFWPVRRALAPMRMRLDEIGRVEVTGAAVILHRRDDGKEFLLCARWMLPTIWFPERIAERLRLRIALRAVKRVPLRIAAEAVAITSDAEGALLRRHNGRWQLVRLIRDVDDVDEAEDCRIIFPKSELPDWQKIASVMSNRPS